METYLLKFSACLFVFWSIYALFLEREKMHHLKRFYLLGVVVLALVIPLLTITYYVEPSVPVFNTTQTYIPTETSYTAITEDTPPFWNLENILWLIYGIGVLLFSTRFIVNLVKMYTRISEHTKVSERSFIYVLLQELRIPHSFFNYIFLNQSKYEADAIPKEVLLHEETHAKQLHSLDILVIELLQIAFWFHPLIYILKHHIKLNHEFLADLAVLQEGVDTKTYQNILLQFSSNTQEYQLSSAINYSSIKKRFTVMKTQTSKTRIWLSSLLLLPIIAILFYSFAEKEYVEKATLPTSHSINDQYARSIDLKILNDNSYLIDGIRATKQTFIDAFNQLHQDITPEIRNNIMNIHVTSSQDISNKETWFIYNALQDYGFYRIVTPNQDINRAKGNTPFSIESNLLTQEKATKKQIAAYNAWAKKLNTTIAKAEASKNKSPYPIIKKTVAPIPAYLFCSPMEHSSRISVSAPEQRIKNCFNMIDCFLIDPSTMLRTDCLLERQNI
jgi:beta-lactamase regulating signal transducer with metallopeptidase domain